MLSTIERLTPSAFPALLRQAPTTLQVNVGYRCNQQCLHCHVAAGPHRPEMMSDDTIDQVIDALETRAFGTLDVTGGAPSSTRASGASSRRRAGSASGSSIAAT